MVATVYSERGAVYSGRNGRGTRGYDDSTRWMGRIILGLVVQPVGISLFGTGLALVAMTVPRDGWGVYILLYYSLLLSTSLYYSLLLSTSLYYSLLLSTTLYYSLLLSITL
jgi:hypothetical protein